MESAGTASNKRTVYITLTFILILGSLFRFYGLDRQSLWNDELATLNKISYSSLEELIDKDLRRNVHPPGYFFFMQNVRSCLGDSETALRLPSAVAGVCAIMMIFILGVQLYSHREGLIAAAIMAVSWCPHIL